jgi:uncharacterized protein
MSELNDRLFDLARRYAQTAQAVLGDDLVSVVLFGSVARGHGGAMSDIDLILVLREAPRSVGRRRALLEPVRTTLQPLLDDLWREGMFTDFTEIVFTADEASQTHRLFLEVIEDGRILYDAGGFFAGVLDCLRARLRQIGAQRKSFGKLRYWDLKPDFKPGDVVKL